MQEPRRRAPGGRIDPAARLERLPDRSPHTEPVDPYELRPSVREQAARQGSQR